MSDIPGNCIRFANFAGMEIPPYNPAGKRNFCIDILDEEFAKQLAETGWNIRYDNKERPDGVVYPPNLKVEIKYTDRSRPRIMMEQEGNKVWLDEQTLGDLDDMEIIRIKDIEIRPYNWEIRGETGVTAYLKAMRIEVARDMFCD